MSDFELNAKAVYANDDDVNPSWWTLFPEHIHSKIITALMADSEVVATVQAGIALPSQEVAAVREINLSTAICLAQHLLGKSLNPAEEEADSLYLVLPSGMATEIDAVLDSAANTTLVAAWASKNVEAVIALVSRQVGRATFQACVGEVASLIPDGFGLLEKVTGLIGNL